MLTDWRAAARALARRPALATTVVLTLTLAIGANGAIFSAVDAVLLKPLPYPSPDRLVKLYERNMGLKQATQLVAPGRLEEWNARNSTFDGLTASYFENMTDTSGPLPERVAATRTAPRFFRVLGVAAALGRWPTDEEERFGGPPVVVVSDAFWRRRLDADPQAVGRPLTMAGVSRTVVGVMPATFAYPSATSDAWLPTQAPASFLAARTARLYLAFGRMKPGVTTEQAARDLAGVQARLGDSFPETDRGWDAVVVALAEEQVRDVRRSLWLLLGAVGVVLLAACSNIAALLLADASRRQHEVAIRLALGADRRRVIAQLVREGLLLAVAGSALGLVVAGWGVAILRRGAVQVPRLASVGIDGRVVAFTFAAGLMATVLFAVAPAVLAARRDPAEALARGGRSVSGGRLRVQRALVTLQVALAIVLLTGAGLLLRSFAQIATLNPGFDAASVLTFRMSAQWSERNAAVMQRQVRTIARLNEIPGVEASAFSQLLPAGFDIPPSEFFIIGRDARERTFATGRAVSAGYFRTLAIPILSGETCTNDPSAALATSALVTRSFADRFFPNENPIGHLLRTAQVPNQQTKIVGVVGDVREGGVLKPAEALIYWCGYMPFWPDPFFLIRTAPGRTVSLSALRAAMHEIEPQRALYGARPLAEAVDATLFERRLLTQLLAVFAGAALALAAMGLYGVLTQLVASRRREIGVRIALGARPRDIVSSIVAQAGAMAGAGIAAGVALALAASTLMASLVFGIPARDPITFVGVPVVLAAVAGLASFLPARRAATTDPMRVLRDE